MAAPKVVRAFPARSGSSRVIRFSRAGAAIYRSGAKDIPNCRGCHGEQAEGRSTAARLAGQHKAYLRLQLQAFGMAARIADPMNHHVWMMTPEQVEAVAAYLGK